MDKIKYHHLSALAFFVKFFFKKSILSKFLKGRYLKTTVFLSVPKLRYCMSKKVEIRHTIHSHCCVVQYGTFVIVALLLTQFKQSKTHRTTNKGNQQKKKKVLKSKCNGDDSALK